MSLLVSNTHVHPRTHTYYAHSQMNAGKWQRSAQTQNIDERRETGLEMEKASIVPGPAPRRQGLARPSSARPESGRSFVFCSKKHRPPLPEEPALGVRAVEGCCALRAAAGSNGAQNCISGARTGAARLSPGTPPRPAGSPVTAARTLSTCQAARSPWWVRA